MVNREFRRRYTWPQAVIRLAVVILFLLAMAFFYGLVVGKVESLVPFPVPPSCKSSGWTYVISVPSADYNCEWTSTQVQSAKRSIDVQLAETSHNALTAAVDISTTKADPLVSEVQRGDAQQDPVSFAEGAVGFLQVAGQPFTWSAPVVQLGTKPGQGVRIVLEGTEFPAPAGGRTEIDFYPAAPGVLRLAANGTQVTGLQGESSVTSEAGNSVTLDYSYGEVIVDLTKTGLTSPFAGPTVAASSPVTGALIAAGRIIGEFAGSLLSAVPWIVFFLLLSLGRSAGLWLAARRRALLRMSRLLATVLLAHLVVWGAVSIAAQDSFLSKTLGPYSSLFSGYAPVPGVTVLFAGLVLFGASLWSGGPRSRSRSYRRRRAATWTAASVVSAAVALPLLTWLLDSEGTQGFSPSPSAWLLLSGALAALAWLALLIPAGIARIAAGAPGGTLIAPLKSLAWRVRPYFRLSAPVAGIAVFLAVAAATSEDSGYLPLFVRWAGLIGVGTVMGLAVVGLGAGIVRQLGRRRGVRGSPPDLAYWVPAAAALAVPWGIVRAGGHPQPVGWSTIPQYAVRLDDLLPLLLVGGGLALFRGLGARAVVSRERVLREHRLLGIAAWFIVLSGSYTFASSASLPALAAMAAAAAAGWLLMPGRQVTVAALILRQTDQDQSRAVADTLRAGAARRVIPAYSKALRDKLSSSGEPQFDEMQDKIEAMEQRAAAPVGQGPAGAGVADITVEELGFGALASRSPWERAVWGARWGAIVGAPWVLLGIAGGAIFNVGPSGGYPELAIAAFVAPLVLRWAAYGFLFGYFYPLLRGGNGLSKAMWFSVAAVVPALVSTLSVENAGASRWESMALLAVQIAAFGTTMGLLADREVLRKHRLPAGRIVDLHNLWAVSAWGSSIGLAVATGLATLIISGLQPFVIGTVAPSTVPVTQQVTPPKSGQ